MGILFLLVLALMFVLGPPRFFSRLGRTFTPFGDGTIATQTSITIVRPEGGNATISAGRAARFIIHVDGRIPDRQQPDALRLCYRYSNAETVYLERLLDRDAEQEWSTSLSDTEIQDGFFYKIKGGDTETAEYRVTVRAGALAEPLRATYRHRPYLRPLVEVVDKPTSLEGWRGTTVTLEAQANRPAREAHLELEMGGEKRTIPGEVDPAQPDRLTYRFVLDQDGRQPVQNGKYSLVFTSTEGEVVSDPPRYDVSVKRDEPPTVTLDKPEQDLALPANGLLPVKGIASDDIGVRDLRLRMEVVAGPKLQAQPYRPEKSFRFEDGAYPRVLAYQDQVDSGKGQGLDGRTPGLKARSGGRVLDRGRRCLRLPGAAQWPDWRKRTSQGENPRAGTRQGETGKGP